VRTGRACLPFSIPMPAVNPGATRGARNLINIEAMVSESFHKFFLPHLRAPLRRNPRSRSRSPRALPASATLRTQGRSIVAAGPDLRG